MSKYKFYVPTGLEQRILNYAKENEESLDIPEDLASKLLSFSQENKTRQVTFLNCLQDEELWYTVYIDGNKFFCYELTDNLLRRTDYGMA